MTAVNPTRLRFQMQGLMAFFNSPVEFHQKLVGLFSLYANYALRFGQNALARPLIPIFNLPHPVLRQLKLDLQSHIEADPQAALEVADQLWQDDYYEIKQTAIWIIGSLPIDDPQPILDRVLLWLTPGLDQVVKRDLLSIGTRSLQDRFPEAWEALILSLLSKNEPEMIALGIQALAEGSKSPNFKNLPAIFRLASPFIRDPHMEYSRDLEDLIEVLAQLSPKETGYFLKQILSVSVSRDTTRLIKNCLSAFPDEVKRDLQSALKK